MKWGDGTTHWVDYSPRNMGRDLVTAQCGQRVHITEFSDVPTCRECAMTDHIQEFKGQYRYLSNFYIEPDSTFVEKEYQARKCADPKDLVRFCFGMNAAQAKAIGQKVKLREDWHDVKIGIMLELVRQKFLDHPALARQLKQTGDAYLEEGNWWNDQFWGTVNGVGLNHLGRILMRVRGEL